MNEMIERGVQRKISKIYFDEKKNIIREIIISSSEFFFFVESWLLSRICEPSGSNVKGRDVYWVLVQNWDFRVIYTDGTGAIIVDLFSRQ